MTMYCKCTKLLKLACKTLVHRNSSEEQKGSELRAHCDLSYVTAHVHVIAVV